MMFYDKKLFFFPQNLFEYAQKCGDFRRENMQIGYFIIWQLCEKK